VSNFEGFDLPPRPANEDWYRPVGPLPKQAPPAALRPKQAPEYQIGQINLPYAVPPSATARPYVPLHYTELPYVPPPSAPPPPPLPATAAQMAQVIQLLREISGVLADIRVNTNRIGR
jgi:hypothetical protein